MKKSTLIFIFLLFFSAFNIVFAQDSDVRIEGKVIDEAGKEVVNLKVSVNDGAFMKPLPKKGFVVYLKKGEKPKDIKLSGNHRIKDWNYDEAKKLITIMLGMPMQRLKGKVYTQKKPMRGAKVHIAGVKNPAFTDSGGSFDMELPPKLTINQNSTITINDSIKIPYENLKIRDVGLYIIITVPELKKPDEPQVTLINKISHQVRLWSDEKQPVPYVKVAVDGSEYTTDDAGYFELILDEDKRLRDSEFFILGYEILKLDFENESNYSIKIKRIKEAELVQQEGQSKSVFREDFDKIINELELEKQLLSQKGAKIRFEIEDITSKLNTEQVGNDQKSMLQSDLERLIQALVATDIAYEDAQAKTKDVVAEMQKVIMQKDSLTGVVQETIEDLEERKEFQKFEFAIGIILILSLIIAFISIKRTRREKRLIEESRARISQINTIGQKISATLNPDMLVQTVHENVNQLVDASVFGVGIYDAHEEKIIFKNFIDGGAMIPYMEERMTDDRKFSVFCIKNHKPVVINDLVTEYKNYLAVDEYPVKPDWPQALIYLPLISEDKAIGVITVQSFKKNAYAEIERTLLEALASYVTIALKNSQAYREIEDKNKNITASIRYAKTIQQAILPSDKSLQNALHEYFTIYKPKDIVSGDFYWFVHKPDENRKFIAAVDCTGHGVPGAFMSMIGHSLLDEIVNADRIYEPAKILENLNIRVREALKQDQKANDDGMDVCLCMMEDIDNQSVKVTFTGAKRPLYYIPKATGKLAFLKGDLKSVGGLSLKQRPFTNQEIILTKGDALYLTSDGLADQSGTNNDKFGTLRFTNLLEINAHLPMLEQKEILETELRNHQQDTEQRDDIMVIGVRI